MKLLESQSINQSFKILNMRDTEQFEEDNLENLQKKTRNLLNKKKVKNKINFIENSHNLGGPSPKKINYLTELRMKRKNKLHVNS